MRKKKSDKSGRVKPTFVAMIIIVVAVIAYLSLNHAYRQQKVGTHISVGINVENGLISGMPLDANLTTFTWLGEGYGKLITPVLSSKDMG